MSNPEALSYVGAITGVIGAISGIVGSVLGVKAYRRNSRDKALDLRVQLHREVQELSHDCEQLPDAIALGLRSRRAVASAVGNTGALQLFTDGCAQDTERTTALSAQLARIDDLGDESEDLWVLERRLIEIQRVRAEIAQLKSRYQAAMVEDDKTREWLRASAIARVGRRE